MTIPDLINGLFELGGGLAMVRNIFGLLKDKKVRGFRLSATFFFTSWGLWNLYYYPHLKQILSFVGGLVICSANLIYFVLAMYYKRLDKEA